MKFVAIAALLVLFACPAPAVKHKATLQWHASTTPGVQAYYIYRDGVKVGQVAATVVTYTDKNPPAGSHSYYVTAYMKSLGQSNHSNTITLIIP